MSLTILCTTTSFRTHHMNNAKKKQSSSLPPAYYCATVPSVPNCAFCSASGKLCTFFSFLSTYKVKLWNMILIQLHKSSVLLWHYRAYRSDLIRSLVDVQWLVFFFNIYMFTLICGQGEQGWKLINVFYCPLRMPDVGVGCPRASPPKLKWNLGCSSVDSQYTPAPRSQKFWKTALWSFLFLK